MYNITISFPFTDLNCTLNFEVYEFIAVMYNTILFLAYLSSFYDFAELIS